MSLARHVDRGTSFWWIWKLVARGRKGDVGGGVGGKKKDLINKKTWMGTHSAKMQGKWKHK